jgi:hypothetical protein
MRLPSFSSSSIKTAEEVGQALDPVNMKSYFEQRSGSIPEFRNFSAAGIAYIDMKK